MMLIEPILWSDNEREEGIFGFDGVIDAYPSNKKRAKSNFVNESMLK